MRAITEYTPRMVLAAQTKTIVRKLLTFVLCVILLIAITPKVAWSETFQEARSVLRAVAAAVLGKTEVENVLLPATLTKNLKEYDPVYHYFSLSGLMVNSHGGDEKNESIKWLQGTVLFENPLLRRAVVDVSARYQVKGNGIEILDTSVRTIAVPIPEIDIFYIPEQHNQSVIASTTLYHMMSNLVEYAVPPAQIDAFGGKYYIYAAARERLENESSLWVSVANTPEGLGTIEEGSQNFDFEGWRIAVGSAQMTINAGSTQFIKIIYRPGASVPENVRGNRVIHVTTNKLGDETELAQKSIKSSASIKQTANFRTKPDQNAPLVGQLAVGQKVNIVDVSKTQPWAYVIGPENQVGYIYKPLLSITGAPNNTPKASLSSEPKSKIMSLSNPVNSSALQQRLTDLGYYSGNVDGKWGASSRKALRTFKAANGLEDSSIWDMKTQDFLFPKGQ